MSVKFVPNLNGNNLRARLTILPNARAVVALLKDRITGIDRRLDINDHIDLATLQTKQNSALY